MSFDTKRKIITPLVFIVISDSILIFTEVLVGDLYTTCIRGFTYSLKAYFEIAIVRLIVDTIKANHSISISSTKSGTSNKPSKNSEVAPKASDVKSDAKL